MDYSNLTKYQVHFKDVKLKAWSGQKGSQPGDSGGPDRAPGKAVEDGQALVPLPHTGMELWAPASAQLSPDSGSHLQVNQHLAQSFLSLSLSLIFFEINP